MRKASLLLIGMICNAMWCDDIQSKLFIRRPYRSFDEKFHRKFTHVLAESTTQSQFKKRVHGMDFPFDAHITEYTRAITRWNELV